MKNKNHLFITALILFAIGISACKKKQLEYGTLPEPNGLVSATINGQPWSTVFNAAGFGTENSVLFSMGCDIYVNGFRVQSFGFANVAVNVPFQKVYSIKSAQQPVLPWSSFHNCEDDATLNGYFVADNVENNFVTVDSYDPATSKVKGRFNLTMYRDYNTVPTPGFDDTLTIKDGTYEVTLSYAP